MKIKYLIIIFLLFRFFFAFPQSKALDSLKLALRVAKHDTIRSNILSQLSESAPDGEWEKYNEQLKLIVEKNLKALPSTDPQYRLFKKHLSNALNNYGFIYQDEGKMAKALESFLQSLKLREELGYKENIANSLNNIGDIYKNMGDISKALEYHARSLKMREEMGDKEAIAVSFNNIAHIYHIQGDDIKALEYHNKGLKLKQEIGDKKGIAISFNNLGTIYWKRGDPSVTTSKENAHRAGITKALDYFDKSLKLWQELGDKKGISYSFLNIGFIYANEGDPSVTSSKEEAYQAGLTKALDYYNKSLTLNQEIGAKNGIADCLHNMGDIYLTQKKYSKAEDCAIKGMAISKTLGFPTLLKDAAKLLMQLYKVKGNYALALANYELFITMRDSVSNQSTRKAAIKSQLKYEYEKQAAADSVAHAKESEIKNAELAQQKAEIKAKRNQQYALYGGLTLVLVFAAFMYNRFKITQKQKLVIEEKEQETQKQNKIISEQKHLVEEKQKELLDSITYARRIQRTLITSESYIQKNIERLNKR